MPFVHIYGDDHDAIDDHVRTLESDKVVLG